MGQFSQLAGYISLSVFSVVPLPSRRMLRVIERYSERIFVSFRDLHGDKVDLLVCNHPPPLRR